MRVSQRLRRELCLVVPAACLVLAAAGSSFAQKADVQQTAGACCGTYPTAGCCTAPGCYPGDSVAPSPYDPSAPAPDPMTPMPDPSAPAPSPMLDPDVAFSPLQSTLLSPTTVAVSPGGYIDNAIPRTRLQIRYDAAYNNNRPDRAEYFYAKCGCFRRVGIDPGAAGPVPGDLTDPRFLETSVDYQDIRLHMEYALRDRASVFIELPFRFLNPEVNDNTAGFGDLNFGFRYALIACPDHYLTFQLRAYAPTGDSFRGLGTDHYSIEPGLLMYRQLTDRLVMIGEFKDWIPIDANDGPVPIGAPPFPNRDFSGHILQYGIGFGYEMYRNYCTGVTITPVVEFVGWTVLDGFATASTDGTLATFRLESAKVTIINAKVGVRVGFDGSGVSPASQADARSLYVGWGHALTDDRWYEDIVRVEYRMNF